MGNKVWGRHWGQATSPCFPTFCSGGALPATLLRSSSGGEDTATGAGPAASLNSSNEDLYVFLPPLLLVAVLQDVPNTNLSFQNPLHLLASSSRQREFDDLGALTLRLQLLRVCLGRAAVQLHQLFSPLANTELGGEWVMVPAGNFSPLTIHKTFDKANAMFAKLLDGVAWPELCETGDEKLPHWAFVFNGHDGPGDSMVVLRLCDDGGRFSGHLVVIHLQSKLRLSPTAGPASWSRIDKEAWKVPLISALTRPVAGQRVVVSQVLLYVSDEALPKGNMRRADDADELTLLATGFPVNAGNGLMVLAVFRDSQWFLRGAVERIKALLHQDMQRQAEFDKRLLQLSLT